MARAERRTENKGAANLIPAIGMMIATLLIVAAFAWDIDLAAVWHPLHVMLTSGHADTLLLIALALTVGLQVRLVRGRSRRRIDAAEALLSENAAVVRACRAVAREFAQPLTGILIYSEMLASDAHGSDAQRHEIDGLREGALRMERLLHSLRDAVKESPAQGKGRIVADDVENAVAEFIPRHHPKRDGQMIHIAGATRYEDPCLSEADWRSV